MKTIPKIIDPNLLKNSAKTQPLDIFLCGPGETSSGYKIRQNVKTLLEYKYNGRVTFGEDLEEKKRRGTTLVDLQTLEAQFAHQVDFTILMLESPGSIAELGTFSMIPNIMARLYIIVPNRFYQSSGYIARGPLSLISTYSSKNIIYYDDKDENSLSHGLMYPICLYKFAKEHQGYKYYANAISQFQKRKFERDAYTAYFDPIRTEFIDTLTLSTINILKEPSFAELVRWLSFQPEEVSSSLHRLFKRKSVEKINNRSYRAINGYSDKLLYLFNSSLLSKRRAEVLAAA